MSKLPIISAAQMGKILRHLGFVLVRQKGSHAYFLHSDGRATVVPIHKGEDLGRGLIRAILRDVEITPDQYEPLRKKSERLVKRGREAGYAEGLKQSI